MTDFWLLVIGMSINIQPLTEVGRPWVRAFLQAQAGAVYMVSRGKVHQCDALPGFSGSLDGKRVGLVTLRIDLELLIC